VITKDIHCSLITQYNEEYWGRLERNWKQWKREQMRGQRTMETIKEEKEKIEQESSGLKE